MKNCVKLELLGAVHSGGVRPFFWKMTWRGPAPGGTVLIVTFGHSFNPDARFAKSYAFTWSIPRSTASI